jgi:hypothetical protein
MMFQNKLETKILALCSSALAMAILLGGTAQSSIREKDLDQDLQDLVKALRSIDYNVRFEKTPIAGKYGLTNAKKKTIWVAPITIEMGIFRKTLIHEAVHAVQSCPSGKFMPIGWELSVSPVIEQSIKSNLYLNYPRKSHRIEKEAFLMQAQTNPIPMILEALETRCVQ